jgi:DNA-binding NarL/FixJ family response regulator
VNNRSQYVDHDDRDDLKVVIADDHVRVRSGVRHTLENAGWTVVAEPTSAGQVVRTVAEAAQAGQMPDVALLGIDLPGGGVRAVAEIAAEHPGLPLVMIGRHYDDSDLLDSVRAGAVGYLTTDADADELPATLARVVAGQPALTPGMVARVLAELRGSGPRIDLTQAPSRGSRLTAREWEVMGLVRQGSGTAAIARQLFLSPATVRVHISSVLRKLRASSREEALRLLDGHGWPGDAPTSGATNGVANGAPSGAANGAANGTANSTGHRVAASGGVVTTGPVPAVVHRTIDITGSDRVAAAQVAVPTTGSGSGPVR